MYLSKEQILAALDRKFDEVDVPEWGGKVRIAEMSALERSRFEVEAYGTDGKTVDMTKYRTLLCVHSIVDESDKPVFNSADIEALGNKSSVALERVFQAAAKLNGLLKSNAEVIEGNSDAAPEGGASSQ